MKSYIYLLFVIFFCSHCIAQNCNWSDNLLFNTGYDQNTNSLVPLPPGSTLDPNWRLINLPVVRDATGIVPLPPQITLNQSYIVRRTGLSIGNWWNNNNNSDEQPISANNTSQFNLNNYDVNQPYRFVREFCVKRNDSINVNVFFKGDDAARVTLYDPSNSALISYTTITGLNATTYSLNRRQNFDNTVFNGYNLNRNLFLQQGTYTLEVEMVASNSRAMGFTLSGGVSSINGSNTLSYSVNCCDVGTIGFVKYLDENCNRQIETDDVIQPNITFNLLQGSTIIATETTNPITGELFFRNIPFGTYTIQEVGTSFILSNNPGQLTINANNKSHYFTLYNCEPKINIKKILDNDCDGTESNGDQPGGAGWDFEVYDGATQVGSCTTNASGECVVIGLPLGNYTVVELPNSSSTYNHPVNNNINVSLSISNIQETVYFYNCQPQIQVRKILDNDCDGIYSSGDQIGSANWTFDLKDISGIVIATSTTNASGIATFDGVPFGNHIIFERPRAGSAYPTPFQNNISVNLTASNPIETLDFFNCPVIQASPSPCCEVDLAIWNPDDGNQHPSAAQTTTVSGVNLSYSEESFEIHQDATIPITELRVSVTDIHFEYNYDQCAECVNNPALWASIYSTDSIIGTSPSQLTQNPPSNITSITNNITNGVNTRELIWDNPNGAMLKAGDTFKIGYILPPLSEIPCCVSKVRICLKISWKDAECRLCERYTCSDIDLE